MSESTAPEAVSTCGREHFPLAPPMLDDPRPFYARAQPLVFTESAKTLCSDDRCHSEGGAARNRLSRSEPWRRPKNLFRKRAGARAEPGVTDRTVRPSGRFFGRRTGIGARRRFGAAPPSE